MSSKLVDYFGHDPKTCRVRQVSNVPGGATLIYLDMPSFLHDGKRLVYNSASGPMLADITTLRSRPLFRSDNKRAVTVSPEGRYVYWQECTGKNKSAFAVHRKKIDGGKPETVFETGAMLAGSKVPAARFSIRTVSMDNRRIAGAAWLGDGNTCDAPFGVVVLDLDSGRANVIAADKDFMAHHLQYCRSTDPEAGHDLLLQMNHGCHTGKDGRMIAALGPPAEGGCDIHALRDDGSNWRDLPWGRDGIESCIGHQVWRGRGTTAVTVTLQNQDRSYGWADGTRQEVIAGRPVPAERQAPHIGRTGRTASRINLSRGFRNPRFCHLSGDDSGLSLALDTFPVWDGKRAGMEIFVARAKTESSAMSFKRLLNSGVTFNAANGYHAHPVISPDGSAILFNSNISGTPQVYLVTDF